MTTKEIEIKTKKTVYVAQDGTEFNDPAECRKYDESALAVLKAKVKKLALKAVAEDQVFSCGSDYHELWIIIPRTSDDITAIKQLLVLSGYRADNISGIDESQIGRVVFLFQNEDSDYMWYQTLDGLVSDATDGKFVVRETIDLEK